MTYRVEVWIFRMGAINLTDEPGLGITLDMDAVEKYRIR